MEINSPPICVMLRKKHQNISGHLSFQLLPHNCSYSSLLPPTQLHHIFSKLPPSTNVNHGKSIRNTSENLPPALVVSFKLDAVFLLQQLILDLVAFEVFADIGEVVVPSGDFFNSNDH